ncbi:MAG: hypothetical protein AAF950_16300 [Pseudomonadota bacterium]
MPSDLDSIVNAINELRSAFFDAFDNLRETESFRALEQTSDHFSTLVSDLQKTRAVSILQEPCDGRIQCAIIGNSSAGKTTLLQELFPDLDAKGWLKSGVNDTTSQALAVSAAKTEDALDDIRIESWTLEQINRLMEHPDVKRQNDLSNISVPEWGQNHVTVAADTASDEHSRFGPKIRIAPFAQIVSPTASQAQNDAFRRALTTKELSEHISTETILQVGDESYNSLQLRAVVRKIALNDRFDRLRALSDGKSSVVDRLTFIDTPGLATTGSEKDEVLRHYLARKSAHILAELWRQDELDVIVHLVKVTDQSNFSELLKYVERESSEQIFRDLGERLVLVMNGTNRFFEENDLRRRYENADTDDGDHLALALIDNVIEKLGPRGALRPARICFVDSRNYVEGMSHVSSYEDYYRNCRPEMEQWTRPGEPGHQSLDRLGIVEVFRENIDALADPDDCGQGFFVRQLTDLVDEKGWLLLMRRFVVRSGLFATASGLHRLLQTYYDDEGAVTHQAVGEALKACLTFDSKKDPSAIETFAAAQNLDQRLEDAISQRADNSGDFIAEAFDQALILVKDALIANGDPPAQIASQLDRHLTVCGAEWRQLWGYESARLGGPNISNQHSRNVLMHCLKLHMREMLHQLELEGVSGGVAFDQTPEDRNQIRHLRDRLRTAIAAIEPYFVEAGGAA